MTLVPGEDPFQEGEGFDPLLMRSYFVAADLAQPAYLIVALAENLARIGGYSSDYCLEPACIERIQQPIAAVPSLPPSLQRGTLMESVGVRSAPGRLGRSSTSKKGAPVLAHAS